MASKKTTTTRTMPSKPNKKQPAAPAQQDTAATPAAVAAPAVDQTLATAAVEPAAVVQASPQEPAPAKPMRTRRPPKTTGDRQPQKLSALEAAAKILAETGQPMTCQELITAMAAKGYWSSPTGQTPSATLYSGILREMQSKGDHARFVKTARGQFALRGSG